MNAIGIFGKCFLFCEIKIDFRSTLKILEISSRLGIFGQCFLFCEKLIPIGAENSQNFESGFFGQTEGICSSPARRLRLVTKEVALNHASLKYIFRNYSEHIKTISKYFLQRWALFLRRHVGFFFNTASLQPKQKKLIDKK